MGDIRYTRARTWASLCGALLMAGAAFVASPLYAATSVFELPWPDRSKRVNLFANMDVQQFTYGSVTPTQYPTQFKVHFQCENGQQVRQFHYTMSLLFKDQNGKVLRLYRANCDLPGRGIDPNKKQFVDDTIDLGAATNQVAKVVIWGQRNGDTSLWGALVPKPQGIAEVLLPVCWGAPQECRGQTATAIIPPRPTFIASMRVDCYDTVQTDVKGDHTVNTESSVSAADATRILREMISEMDRNGFDQCRAGGTVSWREVPGTRRYF